MSGFPLSLPDAAAPRVFDAEAFAELTLRRPALQVELVQLFLSQGRSARTQLPILAGQDGASFKDAVHALLGSARIVAAVALCAVIDRAYAEGEWERSSWREQVAQAVGDAFDAVEPVLREFMAQVQLQA